MFIARNKAVFWLVSFGMSLVLLSGSARADVFDDAWECAETAVDGLVLSATIGAKALKFVATKPDCVARLGTPATAAPIGVVVGLCTAGVLPESQPSCGGAIYGIAAKPIAGALGAALGELGILPDAAKTQLSKIAAGTLAGELLAQVPGIDTVTGSLTCGCDLVAAGLSIETIETVLNTADRIGNACGGPVWDAAKQVAGKVVNFAGDAAGEGIRQVSNLGDAIAGQSKHIDLRSYFDQNWAPRIEDFASVEFSSPGAWHTNQKWRELWEPCVAYFDTHTMSAANAQATCDDMRSGTSRENGLFAGNGFSQRMFRRVFEFDVTGKVETARASANAEYADLEVDVPVPQDVADDVSADAITAKVDARWNNERKKIIQFAVAAEFGTANKETEHNGLYTNAETPPTFWSEGTVGARAIGFYDEVKGYDGNDRADAAKAVQLAMQDLDAQVRSKVSEAKLKLYAEELQNAKLSREVNRDLDQEKVDGVIGACDSQECKEKIASEFAVCRAETKAWYAENESTIANFDSSAGKAATREWDSRRAACLKQANDTLRDSRTAVQGDSPLPVSVPSGIPATSRGLEGRLGGRRDAAEDSDGDASGREPDRDNEVLNTPPASRRDLTDSLRKREQTSDVTSADAAQKSDTDREMFQLREPLTVEPEPETAQEPERESLEVLEPVTGAPGSEPVSVPAGSGLRLRTPLSVAPEAESSADSEPAVEAESEAEPAAEAEAEAEAEVQAEPEAEAAPAPQTEVTEEVLEPVMGAPGTEPVRVPEGLGRRLRTPLSVAPEGEADSEAEGEADAESETEPEPEPET